LIAIDVERIAAQLQPYGGSAYQGGQFATGLMQGDSGFALFGPAIDLDFVIDLLVVVASTGGESERVPPEPFGVRAYANVVTGKVHAGGRRIIPCGQQYWATMQIQSQPGLYLFRENESKSAGMEFRAGTKLEMGTVDHYPDFNPFVQGEDRAGC
jgi:hypothetical protein